MCWGAEVRIPSRMFLKTVKVSGQLKPSLTVEMSRRKKTGAHPHYVLRLADKLSDCYCVYVCGRGLRYNIRAPARARERASRLEPVTSTTNTTTTFTSSARMQMTHKWPRSQVVCVAFLESFFSIRSLSLYTGTWW